MPEYYISNPEVIAHNKQIHGRTFKMAAKNRRLYL